MSTGATVGATLLGSGALTGLVTWLAGKRTSEASASQMLADTAASLVAPMRGEIERLELHVSRLSAQVDALIAETDACHRDRDADRVRIRVLEQELARYKRGSGSVEHP